MTTPNKYTMPSPNLNMNTEINEFKGEPSPIRLQKVLTDEKEQIIKDRERLIRMAEGMTKQHEQQQYSNQQ